MIARVVSPLLVAIVVTACASIDPPADFVKPEAGTDPSGPDGGTRCRVLPRTFSTNATAKVYNDPSGAQAVCVTIDLPVPGAASGSVVFCVAGDLDTVTRNAPREIGRDLRTCAYCVDVQTGCTGDGGSPRNCDNAYAPTSGKVRIVRFSNAPGDPVWIDVGELTVARVVRRTPTSFDVEPLDCLFADGLTFQGTLVAGNAVGCSGLESSACEIANTAASRFP